MILIAVSVESHAVCVCFALIWPVCDIWLFLFHFPVSFHVRMSGYLRSFAIRDLLSVSGQTQRLCRAPASASGCIST